MSNKPVDPKLALGLRVKELRAEKKITQEELADRCDLFRTYISRIESGLANPTLTILHTLAPGSGSQSFGVVDSAKRGATSTGRCREGCLTRQGEKVVLGGITPMAQMGISSRWRESTCKQHVSSAQIYFKRSENCVR